MQNPNLTGRTKFNNQGQQQTNQQGAQQVDEKPFIEIEEYSKFPSSCDCGILTTHEIAEKISDIMSYAYKDFAGCVITPSMQNQGFAITMYFMPNESNTGKARAFDIEGRNSEVAPKSDILANLQATEIRMRSNMFKPTVNGSKGLARYMYDCFTCNNGKDVNWGALANMGALGEKQDSEYGVLQVVTGCFDIIKFLKDIYGTKVNGDVYQYGIIPVRPQSQTTTMSSVCVDWLVMITRYEMKQLQRTGQKCGVIGMGTGTTQMIGRTI